MGGRPLDTQQRKARVASLSVASNTTLIVLKAGVGIASGSVSVLSEAIHSGVDLLAAIIAWVAVRTSGKAADEEHPFGHGKVENISGTVEALLIFVAAVWIIYEAVHKLLAPRPLEQAGLGVAVMLVSAVVNILVSRSLFKVGRETGSVALQADAWHLRTDVWTSAGVMVGLAIIAALRMFAPAVRVEWIDPVAALLVALLILRAAWGLTRESARDLLDTALPSEEVEAIRGIISAHCCQTAGYHGLRTRRSGAHRFVVFHLLVNPDMHTEQSHAIAEAVTSAIETRFPDTDVTVHVEPCGTRCEGSGDGAPCPFGA